MHTSHVEFGLYVPIPLDMYVCCKPATHTLFIRLQLESHFVMVNSHIVSMQRLEGSGEGGAARVLAVAEVCMSSSREINRVNYVLHGN